MYGLNDDRQLAVYPTHHVRDKVQTTPHILAGQPVEWKGRGLYHPSQLDLAIVGVFLKWKMFHGADPSVIPAPFVMKSSDHRLLGWALNNHPWSGDMDEEYKGNFITLKLDRRKLTPDEVEGFVSDPHRFRIVPAVMEDALAARTLLTSTFLPYVRVVPVPTRKRRVPSGRMAFQPGEEPGAMKGNGYTFSAMSDRDTPIVLACSAAEVDSFTEAEPDKLGVQWLDQAAPKQAEWFDRVILCGNGENEPLGIFGTVGATIALSQFGTGGPAAPEDYEALYRGVAKAFLREAGAVPVFVGSEVSYRRSRAMNLPLPEMRRFFGPAGDAWSMLDRPYLTHEGVLSNSLTAFVNLKRYRVYAGSGFDVAVHCLPATMGRVLTSDPPQYIDPKPAKPGLLVTRQRFGGAMEHEGAVCIIRDGQA